jgi:hypothetical protein
LYTDSSAYGPIMRSPNNTCWRITVNDGGKVGGESVVCP